ncbi:hypothetical protein KFK09_008228 [Dendrobium nobile]|uniref:Transmembrane protein n=1 Tax=Dendrobium nobile TaxID=94219 RepID=A0A8T3BQB9_DENNO|nr:hypothetical protein KFK09_008228 [Dendrobium nobile]
MRPTGIDRMEGKSAQPEQNRKVEIRRGKGAVEGLPCIFSRRCCCSASLLRRRCRDCTGRFFGSFVAVRLRYFERFPFLSDRKLRHFDKKNSGSSLAVKRRQGFAFHLLFPSLLFGSFAFAGRCRDCRRRFFGSFVAVRLRSCDDFNPDRKLRHFDRKQERELVGCEGNFLLSRASSDKSRSDLLNPATPRIY